MVLRHLPLRYARWAFRTPWPPRQLFSTTLHPAVAAPEITPASPPPDLANALLASRSGSSDEQTTPSNRSVPDVSDDYERFMSLYRDLIATGATVKKQHLDMSTAEHVLAYAPRPRDVTLELLLASQTHLGHNKSLWNPANSRYIYGVRQGVHMIALEQTAAHLRRAARVVEEVTLRAGLVLFVGTRPGHMPIVSRAAELAGSCHLFEKWRPGTITNRDVILRGQPVEVVNEYDQQLAGFRLHTNEIVPLMPDLVVCLNTVDNFTMLYECGLKNIPTIGVIDTNADPSWVTYAIPANDDSHRSLAVIACVLGRAGQAGRDRRLAFATDSGVVTWRTPQMTRSFIARRHARRRAAEESDDKFDVFTEVEKPDGDAQDEEAMWLGIEERDESFGEMAMLDVLADAQGPEGQQPETVKGADSTAELTGPEPTGAEPTGPEPTKSKSHAGAVESREAEPGSVTVLRLDDLDRLYPLSRAPKRQTPNPSTTPSGETPTASAEQSAADDKSRQP